MAMSGPTLGAAIWNVLRPYYEWDEELPPADYTGAKMWLLIATEIVNHITANGHATGLDSDGNSHNLSLV